MKAVFKGKKITGMLAVMPENEYTFEEETADYSSVRARRLKDVMGYGKRRRVKKDTNVSDMCIVALNHLLDTGKIKREEVGVVLVNTLTPDYFLPQVSNIVHGECGLPEDVLCMDIPQACTGWLMAMSQAFMILEHTKKKAVVFTANVLSRKEKENEHFEEPPFGGDAVTVTVVENSDDASDIYFDMRTDGKERNCLIMPTGAYKKHEIRDGKVDIGDGILRDSAGMSMEGSLVFNFVQRKIPVLIEELYEFAGVKEDDIEYHLFHQPNKFMLQKLADKIGVPREKMFMNIVEEFGNSSGSVLAVNIIHNLKHRLCKEEKIACCLCSFGAGLSWGGMIMELGGMDFCEMIESNL